MNCCVIGGDHARLRETCQDLPGFPPGWNEPIRTRGPRASLPGVESGGSPPLSKMCGDGARLGMAGPAHAGSRPREVRPDHPAIGAASDGDAVPRSGDGSPWQMKAPQ